MSLKALTPVNVPWAAADPTGPNLRAGDLYANSGTGKLRLYGGATWTDVAAAGGGSGTPATTVQTESGLDVGQVGTSTNYAREDHRHPITNLVDLASAQTIGGTKTFSGVPYFTAGAPLTTYGQTLAAQSLFNLRNYAAATATNVQQLPPSLTMVGSYWSGTASTAFLTSINSYVLDATGKTEMQLWAGSVATLGTLSVTNQLKVTGDYSVGFLEIHDNSGGATALLGGFDDSGYLWSRLGVYAGGVNSVNRYSWNVLAGHDASYPAAMIQNFLGAGNLHDIVQIVAPDDSGSWGKPTVYAKFDWTGRLYDYSGLYAQNSLTVAVPPPPTISYSGTAGTNFYFVATAITADGIESLPSAELSNGTYAGTSITAVGTPGTAKIRFYRGTASGVYSGYYEVAVPSDSTNSASFGNAQTAALTGTAAPPTSRRVAAELGTLISPTTLSPIAAPDGAWVTTAGTAFYYKITAVSAYGQESMPSAEIASAAGGTLYWRPVPGAVKYRVYRGTASNAQTGYFEWAPPNPTNYANPDVATLTTGTPPTATNAPLTLAGSQFPNILFQPYGYTSAQGQIIQGGTTMNFDVAAGGQFFWRAPLNSGSQVMTLTAAGVLGTSGQINSGGHARVPSGFGLIDSVGNASRAIGFPSGAGSWSTDAAGTNDLVVRTSSGNILFNVNGGAGASAAYFSTSGWLTFNVGAVMGDHPLYFRGTGDGNHYIQYTSDTADGPRIAGYGGGKFYVTSTGVTVGYWDANGLHGNNLYTGGRATAGSLLMGDVLIYDAGYCRIVNALDNTWKQLNAGAIFDNSNRVFSASYAPSYPGNVAWGNLTGVPGTFASADRGTFYGQGSGSNPGLSGGTFIANMNGVAGNAAGINWATPAASGGGTSTFWCNYIGTTQVSCIAGSTRVNAGTKTFVIDHPTPEKKDKKYLVHAAVEGPESAVFYRGRARLNKGIASVRLPEYFNDLCDEETATVQLTPLSVWIHDHYGVFNDEHDCVVNSTTPIPEYEKHGCNQHTEVPNLVTSPVVDGEFIVGRAGGFTGEWTETAEFYWLVIAERKDVPKLAVELDKANTRVAGDGPYRYILEQE